MLRALREDEAAAASLGKNAQRYRVQAFVIGAAVMGLAGAVQAQLFGFIAPDNYLPALTFQVWVMLVLGGSGNNRGAVAGAVLVWALWTFTGTLASLGLPAGWQAVRASLRPGGDRGDPGTGAGAAPARPARRGGDGLPPR